MSSYRTIHRERIFPDGDTAIWSAHMTAIDDAHWRIFVGSSDGYLRVFQANEKQTKGGREGELDASALQIQCTHTLLGVTQLAPSDAPTATMLGCTQVSIIRNYEGDDDTAGDLIVASLDLGGTVRLWSFDRSWEEKKINTTSEKINSVRCKSEFVVAHASGTTLALASPKIMKRNDSVLIAVGCLNGTISLISTGIAVPSIKSTHELEAGLVVESIGSPGGSALALCLSWNPVASETLVVGRQDGAVDILGLTTNKNHRLLHHAGNPVRSVVFTPDANLLITGGDSGLICIYDLCRPSPVLVHHIGNAHKSWVLNFQCLADSRRFVSLGSDETIHVWNVGQISQALHMFRQDNSVWTIHHLKNSSRMVAGSDDGWLFVYSMEK